jgi:micrococcal nuclease
MKIKRRFRIRKDHRSQLNNWPIILVGLIMAGLIVYGVVTGKYVNNASVAESVFSNDTPIATGQPTAEYTAFRVARVIDGDTIELTSGETVRYIGMDTPELASGNQPDDCYAQEATQANSQMVLGQEVTLSRDERDVDRFGRWLRYVYVNDILINRELVVNGYARAFAVPPDIRYQDVFDEAELQAKSRQVGLWSACNKSALQDWNTNSTTDQAESNEVLSLLRRSNGQECICEENLLDCHDLSNQAEAQQLYDCCWRVTGRDIYALDGNGNNRACENIP